MVRMTLRIGTHVSLTITADATILHLCKQQQIASCNKNERQVNKKSFDLKVSNMGIVRQDRDVNHHMAQKHS